MPTIKPTIGRIVLFAQRVKNHKGEPDIVSRPAIIVNVWSDTCVNLLLFRDGYNDRSDADRKPIEIPEGVAPEVAKLIESLDQRLRVFESLVVWKTSATYDQQGGAESWRWMDYQIGQAAKTDAAEGSLAARVLELERALHLQGRPGAELPEHLLTAEEKAARAAANPAP